MQRGEERLSNARAQRNRLLAAFEGSNAAEDDMEAVMARLDSQRACLSCPACLEMNITAVKYCLHVASCLHAF